MTYDTTGYGIENFGDILVRMSLALSRTELVSHSGSSTLCESMGLRFRCSEPVQSKKTAKISILCSYQKKKITATKSKFGYKGTFFM